MFTIGGLNGILPCGLVYIAAEGAVAIGEILIGMTLMAAFGLGTLPAMWVVAFFGNYLSMGVRIKIRKVYPYMVGLVACLLIIGEWDWGIII